VLIKYVGPMDCVDVPAVRVVAERGVPVEVDDQAAQILLAQTDNWAVAAIPAEQKKG
jgi:hypothetical protein